MDNTNTTKELNMKEMEAVAAGGIWDDIKCIFGSHEYQMDKTLYKVHYNGDGSTVEYYRYKCIHCGDQIHKKYESASGKWTEISESDFWYEMTHCG